MSKANYWQQGNTIDYFNETDKIIEAGTIVVLHDIIGVAGTNITPKEKGSVHISGVFIMPKLTGAIKQGSIVYYTGEAITSVQDGNTKAGYALEDAEEAAETVTVKLTL